MGFINRFDLKSLIQQYDTKYFFETGTSKGDGLKFASKYKFRKIFSCEIIESIYQNAKKRFKNNSQIYLFQGDSIKALKHFMEQMNDSNCIFWLDAHFPGADNGLASFNNKELSENISLPLKEEIETIFYYRKKYSDVFIIDDLRIYEDGPYRRGNIPSDTLTPQERNLDFLYEKFSVTHYIIKLYADNGYILIIPKIKINEFKNTNFFDRLKRRIGITIFPV